MSRIRLLIVDDSATMRAMIRATLREASDIEIVGEAAHPLEAREAIKRLDPDVVTLDIEMPHMDGLSFLEKIMRLRPMPVIIVSTLTRQGASATLTALEIGAIDCIEKPCPGNASSFADLARVIRTAASANVSAYATRAPAPAAARPVSVTPAATQPPQAAIPDGAVDLVAIGASTGGVDALLAVVGTFPADCAPTVIVQHMPPLFTTSFAQRLDRSSAPKVIEATDGAPLQRGTVYLAPGGDRHLEVGRDRRCVLRGGERVNHHSPSVDVLMQSVARGFGRRAAGVILTGMGQDGAHGLLDMRRAGARTLAQDEATCVVYGMPRVAQEIGAAVAQLPLRDITYRSIVGAASGVDAAGHTSREHGHARARAR